MIPWVREKLERHAKWLSAVRRKRPSLRNDNQLRESSDNGVSNMAEYESHASAAEGVRPNEYRRIDDMQYGRSTVTAPSPVAYVASIPIQNSVDSHGILIQTHTLRISQISSSTRHNSPLEFQPSSNEAMIIASHHRIKVQIICPNARLLAYQTDVNKRLADLKNDIILDLFDSSPPSISMFACDIGDLSPRFRILRAEYKGVDLNEQLTLSQLQIEDNETLVLVGRRTQLMQMIAQTREIHPPREIDIDLATRFVRANTVDMPMVDINEIFQQSNLQFDVRKVLISLAQVSATLIAAGPYANRLIAMLKQKLINKRNNQNDIMQCLIDMGFKKETAEYALKVHQNVYASTLEWLIQHQNDDLAMEETSMGLQKSQSTLSPSRIRSDDGVIENTEALLEIVRIYSHREMPPSPESVCGLIEMGFVEKDVLQALKRTCNNKAAACEWLCGNRSDSLIELRDGLALDSPILKSILQLPQVQLNLSNPKILLAFLAILENENTIRLWGGDNDTTSVITHILQKYHEEKHVLGINQFYNNR